ncbi:transcription elongation factor GreA [Patescibacteria group bacterium]|nr:transcription elongation factor GreA [Patescibacteria group bacterium]
MQIPQSRWDKLKVRDQGPVYLTEAGFRNLQSLHDRLKRSLPALIAETQRTAAFGDRSENAEYKEAKSLLRRTHRRILSIEDKIKRVVVIKEDGPTDAVRIGSTVKLALASGEERTFQIVGPDETDPPRGRISFKSPLGAALMKHRVGDEVVFKTPRGSVVYRVLEIL